MPNYLNGKIYKLTSKHSDEVYVGSTCKLYLSERLAGHLYEYNHYHIRGLYYTSFELFKHGPKDVKIQLLERCPCQTKDELNAREAFYIESLNCVNKSIPVTSNTKTCSCGAIISRSNYSTHLKSKKHIKWENQDCSEVCGVCSPESDSVSE
jgi:hypothetical protein